MAEEARKSWRVCGLQLNSLWSVWCFLLVLSVEVYLTYSAVIRYQYYNTLPWQPDKRPTAELSSCLALLVLSLLCLPAFTMSSLFKVGNYSNDGVKLGRELLKETPSVGWKDSAKKLYKHVGPLAQSLHVLSAFFLLLPTVLLEARAIMVSTENLWGTDIDVVFGSETANIYKIMNVTLLPSIEYHLKLPSVEFINYVAAILIYCVRYAAVFWFTHRGFTILFSTQLCMTMFLYIISFCGFNVLYKVLKNKEVMDPDFLLSPGSLLGLFIISLGFIFASSTTVFRYGYYHYNEQLKLCRHSSQRADECHAYIPHSFAMATLFLAAICKAPIIYDYVVLYRTSKHSLILAAIVFDAVYLLFWIVLWLALTLQQDWRFRVLNPHDNYGIELHEHMHDTSTTATMSKLSLDDMSPIKQNGDTEIIAAEGNNVPHGQFVVSMETDTSEKTETPQSETSSILTTESQNAQLNGVLNQKIRAKRRSNSIHQRSVTFRDKVDTVSPRSSSYRETTNYNDFDIVVDVHNHKRASGDYTHAHHDADGEESPVQGESSVVMRPKQLSLGKPDSSPENTLKRNYRYSLRECDRYYHNQPTTSPRSSTASPPVEPTSFFYQPEEKNGIRSGDDYPTYGDHAMGSENKMCLILNGPKTTNKAISIPVISYKTEGNKPLTVKKQMGRRDSANFSLTSSQETSSNESEMGLCSQV